MGYYVEGPSIGKGLFMVSKYKAQQINKPASFESIPAGKGLVIVVENGYYFEAAAYAYDAAEFQAFTDPNDWRPKSYYLMDLPTLNSITGYKNALP